MFIFNPCLKLVHKHQCNKVAGCAEKTCAADEELWSLHQEEGSPRAICAEWNSLCSDCESRFVSKPYTPRVHHLKCCFISLYLLTIIKNEKQTEISLWTLFQDSGFQFSQLAVNHFLSKTTCLCDSPLWGSVSLFNRVWRIFITLQKHGQNSLFKKQKEFFLKISPAKEAFVFLSRYSIPWPQCCFLHLWDVFYRQLNHITWFFYGLSRTLHLAVPLSQLSLKHRWHFLP